MHTVMSRQILRSFGFLKQTLTWLAGNGMSLFVNRKNAKSGVFLASKREIKGCCTFEGSPFNVSCRSPAANDEGRVLTIFNIILPAFHISGNASRFKVKYSDKMNLFSLVPFHVSSFRSININMVFMV